MVCPACKNSVPDGSVFCEFCGSDVSGRPAIRSVAGTGSAAAAPSLRRIANEPASEPSAAALAEIGGALIKRLSLGEKLSGAGAMASVIGFFLPWLTGPDLKSLGSASSFSALFSAATATSYSGLDGAKVWGAAYLILAAAIASAVLFFAASKGTVSRKLRIGGFQVMIGALIGPAAIFALLFVPLMQSVAGLGFWLTGLGFCSVLAGGLVTISQVGKTLQ